MSRKDYPHRVEALLYRDVPDGCFETKREFQSVGTLFGKLEARSSSQFDRGIAVDSNTRPRTHTLTVRTKRSDAPDHAVAFRRDGVLYWATGVVIDPSKGTTRFDLSIHGECDVEAQAPEAPQRPIRNVFL